MNATVCDHVRLQESSFQQDLVVAKGLVNSGQHSLCLCLADLNAVAAICQDLRLNNGHQSILLADDCVPSQPISILQSAL